MFIKAILFDLDALFDTKRLRYEILNKSLQIKGFPPISYALYLTQFNGLSTDIILRLHLPRQTEQTLNEIQNLMQALSVSIDQKFSVIYSSHIKLLKALKQEGYCLALYTSLGQDLTTEILDENDLHSYFDFVFTERKNYPIPDTYLAMFQTMELSPDQILICTYSHTNKMVSELTRAHVFSTDINKLCLKSFKQFIENIDNSTYYPFPQGKRNINFREYIP